MGVADSRRSSDDVIDEWYARRRLTACVLAISGHFKHLLQLNALQLLVHVFFILMFHLHVK